MINENFKRKCLINGSKLHVSFSNEELIHFQIANTNQNNEICNMQYFMTMQEFRELSKFING